MEEQQIVDRGSDAEQFKRYLEENPYFNSVVALAKQLIQLNINSLKPDEQMKFTILKGQQQGVEDLMSLVEIDIYQGQEAIARMQSETRDKTSYGKGAVL